MLAQGGEVTCSCAVFQIQMDELRASVLYAFEYFTSIIINDSSCLSLTKAYLHIRLERASGKICAAPHCLQDEYEMLYYGFAVCFMI